MELLEQGSVFQRSRSNAFAKLSHLLGYCPNALLIFRRKKKRPQKRAMDAIAKGQLLAAELFIELFGEFSRANHLRFQQGMPMLRRIFAARHWCNSAMHYPFMSCVTA